MNLRTLNRWDLTPTEAVKVQRELAAKVRGGKLPEVKTVLGVDVSYRRREKEFLAAALLLAVPEMTPLRSVTARGTTPFPYVPGLLSFREIPPLLPLLDEMPRPDLIVVDGHGIAHPRGMGLASHIGLLTGVPTAGCAKSLLTGKCDEPGPVPGNSSPITLNGKTVGYALRSRKGCKPLYISPGHLLDPAEAVKAVTRCLRGYRLPEATRLADKLSKEKGNE
ncbi:MAG: endonuclease V [bacterium]|nr:endonuclease V [bacterium]MDT8396535.1 endonuclease V [bacterium]